jgi:hypothetical protein
MPLGPGKYDDLAIYCMEQTKADAVVVIVIGGNRGHGMSGKEHAAEHDIVMRPMRALKRKLPAVLRQVARDIEDAPEDGFDAEM